MSAAPLYSVNFCILRKDSYHCALYGGGPGGSNSTLCVMVLWVLENGIYTDNILVKLLRL